MIPQLLQLLKNVDDGWAEWVYSDYFLPAEIMLIQMERGLINSRFYNSQSWTESCDEWWMWMLYSVETIG